MTFTHNGHEIVYSPIVKRWLCVLKEESADLGYEILTGETPDEIKKKLDEVVK